MVRNAKVYAVR